MIDQSYRTYLLNQIIADYLREGKMPLASQVEADLEILLQDFPDQGRPLLSYQYNDLKVSPGEVSSAAKFNRFFTILQQDLNVLQAECQQNDQYQACLFNRNLQEIKMLSSRIRNLDHQLNSQLLVNRETVGYGAYLADNFSDASLVDLEQTTARLDVDHHCVTIGPSALNFTQYPTSQLKEGDVSLNIMTRQGLVRSQPNFQDLSRAFTAGDEAWRLQLYYDRCDQNVVAEIKIKLQGQAVTLNRISFINYGVSTYRTRLEVYTSLDNYNWTLVPSGSSAYYLTREADVRFADTAAQWVKFRFTKEHHDYEQGQLFVYEFGIQSVRFFRYSYQADSAVLVSEPLAILDAQGKAAAFNQVSLEVCENIPAGCDIKYQLSFDGGRSFSPISPLGRPQDTQPLLELGQIQEVISPPFGVDITTTYHYQNPHQVLLSYVLPADLVPGSLRLWRNLGVKGHTLPVRLGLSGWGQDGQFFTCTIQVKNKEGLNLNLGTTVMEINGVARTGSVLLTPGIYQIRSNRAYWSHLKYHEQNITWFTKAVDLGNGVFQGLRNNKFEMKATDPLYPFNHKFLIEGMDYEGASAIQDSIYRGADLFAEARLVQVSEKDLLYNADFDSLNYFAQVPVIAATGDLEQRCLVKYSPLTSNAADRFDLEIFQAFYQEARTDPATTVVFKAILSRGLQENTPQLYSYIIKLSN